MTRDVEAEIAIDNRLLESEEVIALFRPSWLSSDGDDAIPHALIGIGWRKTVRFSTQANAPLVGLRMGSSRHRALRQAVGAVVADRDIGKQLFPSGTPRGLSVWVRYRSIWAREPRFWEDLAPYRTELVTAVGNAWRTFADVVDAVMNSMPSEAGVLK